MIDPDHPYLAINPNDSEVNSVEGGADEEQGIEQVVEAVEMLLTDEEEDASARAFDPSTLPNWLESESMRKSGDIISRVI